MANTTTSEAPRLSSELLATLAPYRSNGNALLLVGRELWNKHAADSAPVDMPQIAAHIESVRELDDEWSVTLEAEGTQAHAKIELDKLFDSPDVVPVERADLTHLNGVAETLFQPAGGASDGGLVG